MRAWFLTTFDSLQVRSFRLLWLGTLAAHLAFFMSTVVQSVVAFGLVGNNTAVGSVVFAQGLSMALLGPLGGALADRWPKKAVVAVSQSVPCLVFSTLAFAYASGAINMQLVAGGAFLIGVTFAFLGPARQALVVELVPERIRGNAIAMSQVASTGGQVFGPGTAGMLLIWERSGAAGAYALMAALYAVSIGMLAFLPRSPMRADARDTRVLADVAIGFRYVFRHPRLRRLVLLYVSVIMTGFPYVTVMPAFVEHELGRDAETYAFLSLLAAIGALTASLAVTRFADHVRATTIYLSMGLLFGLALIALATVPSYPAAMVTILAVGTGFGGFLTLNGAVIVRATEPAFFGRVMSLTMLAFGAFGLMGLPIGLIADAVGERATLAGMGCVVCGLVLAFALRLAGRDAGDHSPPR